MNSFITNNDIADPSSLSLAASAASSTADGSIVTSHMTGNSAIESAPRSNSPSEYKVFNNNESREMLEV